MKNQHLRRGQPDPGLVSLAKGAASQGNKKLLANCLSAGVCISIEDNSIIKLAAANGHLECLRLAIEYGGDINADNGAPLRWACVNGRFDCAKLLIYSGASVSNKALFGAADFGHAKIVEYLLNNGADENMALTLLPDQNIPIESKMVIQAYFDQKRISSLSSSAPEDKDGFAKTPLTIRRRACI